MYYVAVRDKLQNPEVKEELPTAIELFHEVSLQPKKDGLAAGKAFRSHDRLTKDLDELEKMPEPPDLQDAAQKAMTYLEVILDWVTSDHGDQSWGFVYLATILMVGLIYTQTVAGTIHMHHGS